LQFVNILTTEPETDECSYLPTVLDKIQEGKAQIGLEGLEWMVDGGITAQNAQDAVRAGADVLVSGRGVFGPGGIEENMRQLKAAANLFVNQ
jgi:pentose-5-phosphate-3-epimerase